MEPKSVNSEKEPEECILCAAEAIQVFAIGKCDHTNICFACCIKMRVLPQTSNNKCCICNVSPL
jgi:hypothetical protein